MVRLVFCKVKAWSRNEIRDVCILMPLLSTYQTRAMVTMPTDGSSNPVGLLISAPRRLRYPAGDPDAWTGVCELPGQARAMQHDCLTYIFIIVLHRHPVPL